MKSNYNQLGQYIEMVSRTNSDLKYGIEDVRGCSNTKQMMQTRANLIGRTYGCAVGVSSSSPSAGSRFPPLIEQRLSNVAIL